jgi:hypothetical protein
MGSSISIMHCQLRLHRLGVRNRKKRDRSGLNEWILRKGENVTTEDLFGGGLIDCPQPTLTAISVSSFFLSFFLSVFVSSSCCGIDQSSPFRQRSRSSRKASRWVAVKLQFLVDIVKAKQCGLHARSRGGFEMVQKLSTGMRCEGNKWIDSTHYSPWGMEFLHWR